MKFKMKESTRAKLVKLHKEGFLDNFFNKVEKNIKAKTDKELDKIMNKQKQANRDFLKKVKKDPDAALRSLIGDLEANS